MSDVLEVLLGGEVVGRLTLNVGDRSFFAFEDSYLSNEVPPVLSQSFFLQSGGTIPVSEIRQTKLPPFFSNLLPEGHQMECREK